MTHFDDDLFERLYAHVGHDVRLNESPSGEGGALVCADCEGTLYESDTDIDTSEIDQEALRLSLYAENNVSLEVGHRVLMDAEPEEFAPGNFDAEDIEIGQNGGEADE